MAHLFIRSEPRMVFVGVVGVLDGHAGEALVDAAATAAAGRAEHVCVDLDGVTAWDASGATALRAARRAVVDRRGSVLLRADTGPAGDLLGEACLEMAA